VFECLFSAPGFFAYLFFAKEYTSVPVMWKEPVKGPWLHGYLKPSNGVPGVPGVPTPFGEPAMAMELPRIPSGVTGLRNTKMAVMMITTRFMVLHTACDLKPNQL
jgi:hypothetical protein